MASVGRLGFKDIQDEEYFSQKISPFNRFWQLFSNFLSHALKSYKYNLVYIGLIYNV